MGGFVKINKDDFESYLPDNYRIIDKEGCFEWIYEIPTEKKEITVRIFSSVDKRTGVTRDYGKDAIRIVYWDFKNDRPIGKDKRINRTEGATTIKDRIEKRINAFLANAHRQECVDFEYVKYILKQNEWSSFAVSLADQIEQRGSLSHKQLSYVLGEKNPKGKKTFELMAKEKNANLAQDYLNDGKTEEIKEEEEIIQVMPEEIETPVQEEINVNDIELVSTDGYPYKFEKFNPMQSLVVPIIKNDCNIIVAAATAAGKTVTAEIVMEHIMQKNKALYTSPLKALSSEKLDEWKERFPDKKIVMLTGDTLFNEKERKKQFNAAAQANIIIATTELLDSVTRKQDVDFLKSVGLLVMDESHLLASKERGHAAETAIIRFTKINPDSRIMFLSATAPNTDDLSKWLTTLNEKKTEIIKSSWRPVELVKEIVPHPVIVSSSGREDYWATETAKMKTAINVVLQKPNEKFIVFVHAKTTGRKVIEMLKKEEIEAKFHSADLDKNERKTIENSFKKIDGGLRVLIATSTLAQGLNLPAKNVVIVGTKRGINEVEPADIIQEIGRAGRPQYDTQGFAYVVVPQNEITKWTKLIEHAPPVTSVLKNPSVLAFHILAEIKNKEIRNESSALEWYKRSLAHVQENEINKTDADYISYIFKNLEDMEMITITKWGLNTTGLGDVSAWMYYYPQDVYHWFKNMDEVIDKGLDRDERALAWAIADIPTNQTYITRDVQTDANEMISELRSRYLPVRIQSAMSVIAAHNCLTQEEKGNGSIKAIERTLKFNIDRICSAFKLIDERYAAWEAKFLDTLSLRVKYGIPEEIIELTKLDKIGGKRAMKMHEEGVSSLEDVANPDNKQKLQKIFTNPAFARKVINQAKKILKGA